MSGQLILLLKFYLQFFYIQWQIRENDFNSKLFPNFINMDKCINDDDDDDDSREWSISEEILNNFTQTRDAWQHCLYYLANTHNEYVMMFCMTAIEVNFA